MEDKMNKLGTVSYRRLQAQAEEAKELGLTKLANDVFVAIGSLPRDGQELFSFSSAELENEVEKSLWKAAINVIAYHDPNADIQKIAEVIDELKNVVLLRLEEAIEKYGEIGQYEDKLPGQNKAC
jgi:hypothetical protein